MNTRSLRFRLTAWYASLLAGALLLFGISVYIGLEQYLEANATRTLEEQAHSIGTEINAEYAKKGPAWLASEIEEAYAPEINGNFVRVSQNGTVVYQSAASKDAAFDPAQVPSTAVAGTRHVNKQVALPRGRRLLLVGYGVTTSAGDSFLVETGIPDEIGRAHV